MTPVAPVTRQAAACPQPGSVCWNAPWQAPPPGVHASRGHDLRGHARDPDDEGRGAGGGIAVRRGPEREHPLQAAGAHGPRSGARPRECSRVRMVKRSEVQWVL